MVSGGNPPVLRLLFMYRHSKNVLVIGLSQHIFEVTLPSTSNMMLMNNRTGVRDSVATQKNFTIALKYSDYVPVMKDDAVSYGGSQMWFPDHRWFSRDYVLHNYGCGTIATADLFLYLAIHQDACRNPITEAVLQGTDSAGYTEYMDYVRKIDGYYTKTKRWLAVLGPRAATAINDYSRMYGLRLRAKWKWSLTYYDMLEVMEGMLSHDLPVILSIGPNTPNLWGKKGIPFYQQHTEEVSEAPPIITEEVKELPPSKVVPMISYKPVQKDINGHFVTVTGIIKDSAAARIMLRISSWGKEYYINYEEYRDYIGDQSGTYTSSIIDITRKG